MRHWCSAGPSNVRVNAIAPGATKTNLADDSGGFNMNALPAAMEEQIASYEGCYDPSSWEALEVDGNQECIEQANQTDVIYIWCIYFIINSLSI